MRRWLKRIAVVVGLCLLILGCVAYWAVRQTKHVPEFYSQATGQLPNEETVKASQRLQDDVSKLRSDAAKLGFWKASFSDAEINAWLVEELPKRFPLLQARGVSDPRIVIEDDHVLVAARYKDKHWDTIVSFQVNVELTEEANMLAIRLTKLRAGALPMPLERFLKGITKEAAKGDIDIRWDMTESGPVALVTVPREHPNYAVTPVIVESIKLSDGQLNLSGHTGKLAESIFKPKGPVHRFVSYRHTPNRSRHSRSSSSDKSLRSKMR